MLKAGDLARREDRRVKGVKIGKTLRDRGISHACLRSLAAIVSKNPLFSLFPIEKPKLSNLTLP